MRVCKKCDLRMRAGFTLVELLVVIAIITLLVGILLPSLSRAKEIARTVLCLTNLKGMGTALHVYMTKYDEHFPLAYHTERVGRVRYFYAWDFTTTKDWDTGEESIEPGTLWDGEAIHRIHQCPSFDGAHNWMDDPFTGYNYNTSYLGYNEKPRPAGTLPITVRASEVKNPAGTAVFGDAGFESGSNKFMRAPWRDSPWDTFVGRSAGTQAFRHLGKSNVCWADGHATSWTEQHQETHADEMVRLVEGTGYLSADNSLYDLE
jgi:prepilin-type N-terminal cleavage/methylation domain-containing protein/prepilin-type processing-associated H-X9-DG protein